MGVTSSFAQLLACLSMTSAALLPSVPSAFSLTTNTSSPPPLQSSPSDIFERVGYLVPETTTFVDVLLFNDLALNPIDVEVVLSAIEQQLTNHILQHGDSALKQGDDPYDFGVPACSCTTGSDHEGSLTYGILRDAMRGLQHVMVTQQRFHVAYYDITYNMAEGPALGDGAIENRDPALSWKTLLALGNKTVS